MSKFSHSSAKRQENNTAREEVGLDLREGESYTLAKINRLPLEVKRKIYAWLIPPKMLTKFQIAPESLFTQEGEMLFRCHCQPRTSTVRIELRHQADFPDPIFLLEMTDTSFGDLEILFLNINNPFSPRFDIDRDAEGHDTVFATVSRNIPEEIRAMRAGLAPGQTRRGLRMFRNFRMQASLFCQRLGMKQVKVEPLAYHNAIMHEFYGFRYITGRDVMEKIDREFRPGGILFQRLDGSSPFRQPGFERSICGRSWAIHDGILDEPWKNPRMYYTFDEPTGRVYDEFTCRELSLHNPLLPY
ncbi:hypothetical protein U27_01074 [Candidatus Vecturithrix granuli]|uniref:Uncharacterized protein n=1 Tax=Vecturithrix granuli TaxID=1499967 RepID=A0A081C9C0_VECG1|nr:hypothetical protein U27_01074 [Candidatus Vecturithrix granuli]